MVDAEEQGVEVDVSLGDPNMLVVIVPVLL
jgi:hypothetical protein